MSHYIPSNDTHEKEILDSLNISSFEDLIKIIPKRLRVKNSILGLEDGISEYELHSFINSLTDKISDKYLNIIRYHSLYPWHTGGDYYCFMKEKDKQILKDVLMFNNFDLYSKKDKDFRITEDIKSYYNNLLNEFFPKELQW